MAEIIPFKKYIELQEVGGFGTAGMINIGPRALLSKVGDAAKLSTALKNNMETIQLVAKNSGLEYSKSALQFLEYKYMEALEKTSSQISPSYSKELGTKSEEESQYVDAIISDYQNVQQIIVFLFGILGQQQANQIGILTDKWFKTGNQSGSAAVYKITGGGIKTAVAKGVSSVSGAVSWAIKWLIPAGTYLDQTFKTKMDKAIKNVWELDDDALKLIDENNIDKIKNNIGIIKTTLASTTAPEYNINPDHLKVNRGYRATFR